MNDDELLTQIDKALDLGHTADFDALTTILSPKRVAMLRYAVKLSSRSSSVKKSDICELREQGFSDTDLLQLAELVGYFAYVNRIADGLGVALEE